MCCFIMVIRLVGCVIPGLNGVVGLLVMIETGYDTVNAKYV